MFNIVVWTDDTHQKKKALSAVAVRSRGDRLFLTVKGRRPIVIKKSNIVQITEVHS